MAYDRLYSYRHNLERAGEPRQVGDWRIAPMVDPVSEREYLFFKLNSRVVGEYLPSVLSFRADAAPAMAPGACPPIHSLVIENTRLELLIDAAEVLSADAIDAADFAVLFDTLVTAIAAFDRHGFQLSDLYPEALGRTSDGHFVILPNAFIVPHVSGLSGAPRAKSAPLDVRGAGRLRGAEPHSDFEAEVINVSLVGRLIDHLDLSDREGAFEKRLVTAADAISRGDIATVVALREALFDRPAAEEPPSVRPADYAAPSRASVDSIVEHVAEEGRVVVVRGRSYTGKSSLLKRAAALLGHSKAIEVIRLDEWDLFTRSRRAAPKSRSATHSVWIVDDIDEKAFACSEMSAAMTASPPGPKGSVILSTREPDGDADLARFLADLEKRRGADYLEVRTGGDGNEDAQLCVYLASALAAVSKETGPEVTSPEEGAKRFLSKLRTEERQILEFLSVARFAMPLDLVLSVFTESGDAMRSAILRLVSLNCLEIFYHRFHTRNALGLFVRAESTALRRVIYRSLPDARRRKLHRTVTVVAELHEGFPTYLLIFHAFESGDLDLAAKHAVAHLKETKRDRRHPNIVALCAKLAEANMFGGLPFADRVHALHELSVSMLDAGRSLDAERLLIATRDIIDDAEIDQKLRTAPRLSAVYRLLADQWDARGEFTRARDLLEDARDELQSALPIPEQAQLANDIGWLHYRLGDYEKTMDCCRLSLNTLNANQHAAIVAQALNLMGVVHFLTSRYDEAISYYEQGAQLRQRSGDDNALAASYNNLALAYQSKGEYEKALEYHRRSLDLKRAINNRAGIAGGYLNLARLYLEVGNFKEAEAKCRESLALSEELENAQLVADNFITLGDIAIEGGDFATAEKHYLASRRISRDREAINEEMGALRRLSTLCLKQERFDEARTYAEEAKSLVQRIGSRFEAAQIEMIFGDLELQHQRVAEAAKHFELAATGYTQLSKYRLAATALAKIGLMQARAANSFEARHYLDRAQEALRADTSRELPEEFLQLQQLLRAQPVRGSLPAEESQKLLMAFYELSSLTDFAADRDEFFRRTMDAIHQLVDPIDSLLVVRTESDNFVGVDAAGKRTSKISEAQKDLFRRAHVRSAVVDSTSADVADIAADIGAPAAHGFVCVPLKSMGERVGCLLLFVSEAQLPLSKEAVTFFTWVGRQLASNLQLMLHLNPDFLKDDITGLAGGARSSHSAERHRFEDLIGKSEAMKRIFHTLEKVKHTDSGILILGESGTGKSALARAIHHNSPRQNHPFQEIHCAQIPHNLLESELFGHERGSFTGAIRRKIGLCEMANGGTLFLDDINVMPVETQTKLLQFLESKSFMRLGGTQRLTADVRIIAASNEDLEKMCREGKFREDLFYRLKVILIDLPPLRERPEDMLAIALEYIKRSCTEKKIPTKTLAPETIQILQKAPWRGNVRELQNVLERIIVLSDETLITPAALPEDFLKEVMGTSRQANRQLDSLVDEIIKLGTYSDSSPLLPALEALLAQRMVEHVDGKGRAASLLGISKPTLYARLRDYDKMQ